MREVLFAEPWRFSEHFTADIALVGKNPQGVVEGVFFPPDSRFGEPFADEFVDGAQTAAELPIRLRAQQFPHFIHDMLRAPYQPATGFLVSRRTCLLDLIQKLEHPFAQREVDSQQINRRKQYRHLLVFSILQRHGSLPDRQSGRTLRPRVGIAAPFQL
jgi:hypothetical protein